MNHDSPAVKTQSSDQRTWGQTSQDGEVGTPSDHWRQRWYNTTLTLSSDNYQLFLKNETKKNQGLK